MRRPEAVTLTAGIAVLILGALTMLDRFEVLDLEFGVLGPAVLAAVGAVLLVSGLSEGG